MSIEASAAATAASVATCGAAVATTMANNNARLSSNASTASTEPNINEGNMKSEMPAKFVIIPVQESKCDETKTEYRVNVNFISRYWICPWSKKVSIQIGGGEKITTCLSVEELDELLGISR